MKRIVLAQRITKWCVTAMNFGVLTATAANHRASATFMALTSSSPASRSHAELHLGLLHRRELGGDELELPREIMQDEVEDPGLVRRIRRHAAEDREGEQEEG